MFKKIIVLTTVLLSGCAAKQMPDEIYDQMALFRVGINACVTAGKMDPKLHADASTAMRYILGTWQYSPEKLSARYALIEQQHHNSSVTDADCRQLASYSYTIISQVSEAKGQDAYHKQQTKEAIDNFNRSMQQNKPVYCNTIGTMTTCY